MESMGLVTDGLNKPKVDAIVGLSTAIGVSQRGIAGTSKSTVGTYTEIATYLRVLFAKLGQRTCPSCGVTIPPSFSGGPVAEIDEKDQPCPSCGHLLAHLTMGMFSFNKPEGACPDCGGEGKVTTIDLTKVVDESLSLAQGAVRIWGKDLFGNYYGEVLEKCGRHYGFPFDASKKIADFNELERLVFYEGVDSEAFLERFPHTKKPKKVHDGYVKGILTYMEEKAKENLRKQKKNSKLTDSFVTETCTSCKGSRLAHEGRTVTIQGSTLVEVGAFDMVQLDKWLDHLDLPNQAKAIKEAVESDLKKRVQNLIKIGLHYLSLNRPTGSLSGGEAQRLKLSNIIDSGLTGVLYVLDEPTTGLHPHDGKRLLEALKHIRDLGNTVLVIEYDTDFIGQCDHVIDFGPGSSPLGGQIVFSGSPHSLVEQVGSLTGRYMTRQVDEGRELAQGQASKGRQSGGRPGHTKQITVRGGRANNLKDVNVHIPLNQLVTFTGVSGSGKSSLVIDVIDQFYRKQRAECDQVDGLDQVNRLVTIDQKPIGRMTRSNVATYTETYALIRKLYSQQAGAKAHQLKASDFSFNVKGGRCESCQGLGVVKLDMHFLDDVEVECSVCQGHRFNEKTLSVRVEGKHISDVLDMTVDQAREHFHGKRAILKKLDWLHEVGLGYLKLGQSTLTLSGGECQRLKLAKELTRSDGDKSLYILDEPTTGLHPADIDKLLTLLYALRDKGHSIFLIEHALEVIAASDHIIDLGPAGGHEGGTLIDEGPLGHCMGQGKGLTSQYLQAFMGQKTRKEGKGNI